MSEKLAKKLGIEHQEIVTFQQPSENLPALTSNDEQSIDQKEDYDRSREIYKKVAEVGTGALDDLKDIARMTGEPRAYEVIATLMKSLNETAKQMNEIHNNLNISGKVEAPVNIDKAVFVGSQTDLLEMLKKSNNDK